jgi:hypothetical protein
MFTTVLTTAHHSSQLVPMRYEIFRSILCFLTVRGISLPLPSAAGYLRQPSQYLHLTFHTFYSQPEDKPRRTGNRPTYHGFTYLRDVRETYSTYRWYGWSDTVHRTAHPVSNTILTTFYKNSLLHGI